MNLKKILKIFSVSFLVGYASIFSVSAQSNCTWLPQFLCDLLTPNNPILQVEARIRAAFFIAIGVIILVAIAYGIYNAYKYIKGGDSMEEANKGMRAILFGIGSLFVIMLGIVVVLYFFDTSINALFPKKICLDSPEGNGCYACSHTRVGEQNELICNQCDSNPDRPSVGIAVPRNGYVLKFVNEDGDIVDSTDNPTCQQPVTEVKQ